MPRPHDTLLDAAGVLLGLGVVGHGDEKNRLAEIARQHMRVVADELDP